MGGHELVGATIDGKYRVERELGRGGMGLVLAARHVRLGHLVAIKFPIRGGLASGGAVERLLREARAVMRLNSDHVARVFDIGVHERSGPFLVMEYLEGRDLGAMVRQGPLPVQDAVTYLLQACEALAEAHAKGIVHRDIKPSNLLLTKRADGTPWLKVIDFGLAKSLADETMELTRSGAMLGSPCFMAPEQMRGAASVDARADIWSLGATLYMLVTSTPPFAGNNVLDVYEGIRAGRPTLASLGRDAEALEVVLDGCLQLSPDTRYASVADLATQLATAAGRDSVEVAKLMRRIADGTFPALDESPQRLTAPVAEKADATQPPLDASWRPGHGTWGTAGGSLAISRSGDGPAARGTRWGPILVGVPALLGVGSLFLEQRGPSPSRVEAGRVAVPSQRAAAGAPESAQKADETRRPVIGSQAPASRTAPTVIKSPRKARATAAAPALHPVPSASHSDPLADPD